MNRVRVSLAGALAGAGGALVMIVVMLALRRFCGIPTPAELIGDRIVPLLGIQLFVALLVFAWGYNRLKQLGVGSALAGQIVLGAVIGLVYAWVLARERERNPAGDATGRADRFLAVCVAAMWVASILGLWPTLGTNDLGLTSGRAALATALGLLVSYAAFGVSMRVLCRSLLPPHGAARAPRPGAARRALLAAGWSAVAGIAAAGLLRDLFGRAVYRYDGTQYGGLDVQPITPNERFYVVTKNNVDPSPLRGIVRLEIRGMVERPMSYRFDDLLALPAVTQETTLECISNNVGSGLISNAIWKGVPLASLIHSAGPKPGVREVVCRAVDGYADNITFSQAMDPRTVVAYEMNGVPLPGRHGFPVRLIVPGMFGEKSVKWLTRIELLDHRTRQFYEVQGWGPNFVTPTFSRFDGPDLRAPIVAGTAVALRGVAFAGSRGVDRVEVSTDDGQSWRGATLTYRTSPLAWALWSFSWTPRRAGDYHLVVRAIDGTGAVQVGRYRHPDPEGATGYHRVGARVQ